MTENWLMDVRRLIAVSLELTAEFFNELAVEINPPPKKPERKPRTAKPNWWEGVVPGRNM